MSRDVEGMADEDHILVQNAAKLIDAMLNGSSATPDFIFVFLVMATRESGAGACHYISNGKTDYVIRQLEEYVAALKERRNAGMAAPDVTGHA
jgi:hypothetical protein